MKKIFSLILAVVIEFSLSACSKSNNTATSSSQKTSVTQNSNSSDFEITSVVDTVIDKNSVFTSRDLSGEYDKSTATKITLNDDGSTCDSSLVDIDDNTITITGEDVFYITGSLTNGQIIVDADSGDKIQLVLDNVSINCDTSASIYVKNAKKVIITLAENSTNTLSNKSEFVAIDDNNVNGVIYSKDNLTLNGKGTLTVDAKYGNGVVCNDDLVIASGIYNITSENKHAIKANDSVLISDGEINLTCLSDGIHCENSDDTEKGYVYISDCNMTINAEDDGIHAGYFICVDGGEIDIKQSKEGIEAQKIDINGGNISVVSSDDGFNAATSSDSSGDDFAFSNPMDSDTDCYIYITGGNVTVDANGDGLDSNGYLLIEGGIVTVYGSTSGGDASLDYGASAKINGGTVIALGNSSMVETFSSSSTQCILFVTFSSYSADEVVLADSNGNELLSLTTTKSYNHAIISSADIVVDETYTISKGDESYSLTPTSTIYKNSSSAMGMGAQGGGAMGRGR